MKKAIPVTLIIILALSGFVGGLLWLPEDAAAAPDEDGGSGIPIGPDSLNMLFRDQVGGATTSVAVVDDYVIGAVGPRLITWHEADGDLTPAGASESLPGNIEAITVADHVAIAAVGEFGVFFFDLTDETDPALLSSVDTDVYAFNLAVDDALVYVADFAGGVLVLDISNPAAPLTIGTIDLAPALAVTVAGDVAYVALGSGGLGVVELGANGLARSSVIVPHAAFTLDLAESFLFAAGSMGGGLSLLDISRPLMPVLLATYPTNGYVHGVTLVGGQAYVRVGYEGIYILDLTQTESPAQVGFYAMNDAPVELALAGDRAYVAAQGSGLTLLDVTNVMAPAALATWQTSGVARDIAVAGDFAFVAAEQGGLRVLNLGHASVEIGALAFEASIFGVATADGFAYLTAGAAGLFVVDVTNPAEPALVGQLPLDGFAWRAVVDEAHLYVTARSEGLHIIDISNPAAPILTATYQGWGDTQAVTIAGDTAYLADYAGLQIVDISDPAQPIQLSTIETTGYATDVAIRGGHAYVADFGGVRVIDVTNPSQPMEVAFFDTPGAAIGIAIAGEELFVAAGQEGVRVLHLTTPTSMMAMGFYDTPGMAESLAVVGNQVLVADQYGGLDVVDYVGTFFSIALPVVVSGG